MARHPHKRKAKLTKQDRAERDERNARRGRTPAYLKAKAWAEEQEQKIKRRKLRSH